MQSQTELRQTVTNTIIEALNNGGLPPWRKPWSNDGNASGPHTSLSTDNPYRGINQILLQVAAMKHGYKSKWWGTYRQIAAQGALVRLGQKATRIVLWKPIQKKKSNEQDQEVEESFLVMREFCVFNVEQTTGLEKFQVGLDKPQIDTAIRYENADLVIDSTGADIRYGGNEALCNLVGDYIQMPHRHQFESPEAFYETSFHELGHWTEHPNSRSCSLNSRKYRPRRSAGISPVSSGLSSEHQKTAQSSSLRPFMFASDFEFRSRRRAD